MPTDTTITRYKLHIENDDAWLVTDDSGEWARYEDHERALTAAHAARDAAERHFKDIQWSRDAAWGIARAWGIEAIRPEMRDRAKADPFVADVIGMADALTTALRERDEARAAVSRGTGVNP